MNIIKDCDRFHIIDTTRESNENNGCFRQIDLNASGKDKKNIFRIIPNPCLLEIEDLTFNHNSAVPLPVIFCNHADSDNSGNDAHWEDPELANALKKCHPESYKRFCDTTLENESLASPQRITMAAIAVTLLFMENNPNYRCVIAGHADTSGQNDYNFNLSKMRAQSILYLIEGKKQEWVSLCQSKYTVTDYKLIMNHYSLIHGLDCYFDKIDNSENVVTKELVYAFQCACKKTFGSNLTPSGQLDKATWEMIFELYTHEIALLLGVSTSELNTYRNKMKYVDDENRVIACGERIPIDEPDRNNYRSAENRRVEILFFHEKQLPDLSAHLSGGKIFNGTGKRNDSGVYTPGYGSFIVIEPLWWEAGANIIASFDPHFDIRDITRDLSKFPDTPSAPEYDMLINEQRQCNQNQIIESCEGSTMKGIWSGTRKKNEVHLCQ